LKGENKLKTEILSQEKEIVEAKAQFTAEEIAKAIDETYKKISREANIKGFRKGKVPRRAIELYFPKETVLAETLEKIIPDAVDKMVEEFELKLIGEPELKPEKIEEGKGYEFTVKFEVTPDIELPDISEIEIEKPIYETTPEMVQARMDSIIDAYSELVPTYEERPLTKEDYASVKFDTIVCHEDGSEEKAEEGRKTEIFLGAPNSRPEVVDAIVGRKPGEKVSVELPLSGEDAKTDHALKSRHEIEILGIMKKKDDELTDEKVKEITGKRIGSIDEFRAEIEKHLKEAGEARSAEAMKDNALFALCDKIEVELPQKLVERQKAAMKKQQEERLKGDDKTLFDDYLEKNGMDREVYDTELDAAARNIVKQALVLEAVADENDIQCTPDDLSKEIASIARRIGVEEKKFQEYVYGDANRLYNIADKLRHRKTLDYLVSAMKVKESAPEKEEKAEEKEGE